MEETLSVVESRCHNAFVLPHNETGWKALLAALLRHIVLCSDVVGCAVVVC